MAEHTDKTAPRLSCLGGCGKSWADQDEATIAGSEFLAVARAWRCGACTRELLQVSIIRGEHGYSGDDLPKDSRGALPKNTSATIVEPRVRT